MGFQTWGNLITLFDPIIYLPLAIFFCLFLCLKFQVKRFASNVHITGMSIGSHTTNVRINLLLFKGIVQSNVNIGAIWLSLAHCPTRYCPPANCPGKFFRDNSRWRLHSVKDWDTGRRIPRRFLRYCSRLKTETSNIFFIV